MGEESRDSLRLVSPYRPVEVPPGLGDTEVDLRRPSRTGTHWSPLPMSGDFLT